MSTPNSDRPRSRTTLLGLYPPIRSADVSEGHTVAEVDPDGNIVQAWVRMPNGWLRVDYG